MAASQRVQILTDKSEELSILSEFLRNPNLIEQLKEEVKKLNSLSDSEEQKLSEARNFLKQHNDLSNALEKEKLDFEEKKLSHDREVEYFNSQAQSKAEYLNSLSAELNTRAISQAETEKRHLEERKKLDFDKSEQERKNKEDLAKINADAENVKRNDAINQETKARLDAFENKLKETAAKMQGLVSE